MSLRRYSDGSVEMNYYDEPTPDGQRDPEDDTYRRARYPVWVETLKVFLMMSVFMFPVLFITYYLGGETWRYWYFPAGMLLMPIFTTIVRRQVPGFVVFALSHLVLGFFVLLSPHIILTLLCVVYIAILILYDFMRVISKEKERDMSYFMLLLAMGILLFVYGLFIAQEVDSYERYLLPQGLIWALLFLFYKHRTNIMSALRNMDKAGNLSPRQTVRFNTRMFLVYLGIAAGIFGALYFLGFGKLLTLIGRRLLLIIRRIVRALADVEPSEQTQAQEAAAEEEIMAEMLHFFEDPKTSPFWIAAEKVLIFIGILLCIALVIYLVVALVRRYQAGVSYQGKGYEEIKTFTFTAKDHHKRTGRRRLFDFGPENAVRRSYYRKVKGKMGKTVQPSFTPREVGKALPDVAPIVEMYEQVRYQETGRKA